MSESKKPQKFFTKTPLLGFAAFSGTGKTTLLQQLIPILRARGFRIGLLKHSHHKFEVDRPGKDSYLLRHAGATQLVVASAKRSAIMRSYADHDKPQLSDFLRDLDNDCLDLLLVEGYKHAPIPKIELHRPSLGHPLLAVRDKAVVAVASDASLPFKLEIPQLSLNEPVMIADFIEHRYLA